MDLKQQQQQGNIDSQSTQWSGPLSYASVVMSARDSQCDWKERQQRVLVDAADGIVNYFSYSNYSLNYFYDLW